VFVLIGDGELRSSFEQKVNSLGLAANFLFLGARNDVPDILSCCDAGLLASLAEGLPNAVLEYMAASLPVIATCVGGIPEIIGNSGAGLMVPPADPAALADAICTVLSDRGKSLAMGQNGRKRVVEQFSFNRLLAELEALYAESTSSVESNHTGRAATIHAPDTQAITSEVHNRANA
jgi:glycosyltransferase involved in cell wall biosynthesis